MLVVPPITKDHNCLFDLTKEIDWTPSNSLNPKLVYYLKMMKIFSIYCIFCWEV